MKTIPQRTCMGCNLKAEKKEFIRIIKNNNDKVEIDITGKKDGRGAYICNKVECLEKVIKTKKLERILKIKISEDIYNELRGVIIEK